MQLEVVLLLEGLLADRTLEAAADAVRGEVAPEVSLALENLADREGKTLRSSVIMSSRPPKSRTAGVPFSGHCGRLTHLLAVWAGEAVGGGEEMLLQSLLGGISALTLGTPEVKHPKKKK